MTTPIALPHPPGRCSSSRTSRPGHDKASLTRTEVLTTCNDPHTGGRAEIPTTDAQPRDDDRRTPATSAAVTTQRIAEAHACRRGSGHERTNDLADGITSSEHRDGAWGRQLHYRSQRHRPRPEVDVAPNGAARIAAGAAPLVGAGMALPPASASSAPRRAEPRRGTRALASAHRARRQ